jgi:Flp pilus assembly protein TadG
MNKKKSLTKSERGQSMAELGIGMVILLILLAGIVDLGRAFYTYMALRDAAQEGAVYGSICPADTTEIVDRVRSASKQPVDLKDTSHVKVDCAYVENGAAIACDPNNVPEAGNQIKIQVSYDDFRISMPFLGTFLGTQSINLRAGISDTILRTLPCE